MSSPITAEALLAGCGIAHPSANLLSFANAPNEAVIFGPGCLDQVGPRIAALSAGRVLVVTDPGIAGCGHLEHLVRILKAEGLQVASFTAVKENPDTDVVAQCVAAARQHEADCLVGLGGGSSMDAAKGCNFILTNGGEIKDYWGTGKATQPMLPFVAIPTTAGTGSECQSYALISDAVTHAKMACGDKKAAARLAVLDPLLTMTQPPRVTCLTGLDALAHALESAVCNKATPLSREYSRAAFALLAAGFPKVLANPDDLESRSRMLLGAALAGIAIENSMLGAAHAAANPLTARFHVVHGDAVGVMLAPVLRMNLQDPVSRQIYGELAALLDLTADDLPSWWENLLSSAGIPARISAHGAAEAHLPDLAEFAAKQWTGSFNPVPVDAGVFELLYKSVL